MPESSCSHHRYTFENQFGQQVCLTCGFIVVPRDPERDSIREYASGATRDTQAGKPQYFGYLGWQAIERFGQYMLKHQTGPDGKPRAADNWKKGIPLEDYVDSLTRHVVDFNVAIERGDLEAAEELACAILFNTQGFLQERMKGKS